MRLFYSLSDGINMYLASQHSEGHWASRLLARWPLTRRVAEQNWQATRRDEEGEAKQSGTKHERPGSRCRKGVPPFACASRPWPARRGRSGSTFFGDRSSFKS